MEMVYGGGEKTENVPLKLLADDSKMYYSKPNADFSTIDSCRT